MGPVQVKTGPTLVLEQVTLFQLLGMDSFYDALPPGFEDMRGRGVEIYQEAVDSVVRGKDCLSCSTLGKLLQPFQNELGVRLAAVYGVHKSALEPLATMITDKRAYRPTPILLYYKDEGGRISVLQF